MEKRFVLFIVLSLGVLTGYALLKSMLSPEKPVIVDAGDDPADVAPPDPDGGDPVAETGEAPTVEPAAGSETTDPPAVDADAATEPDDPAPADGPPKKWPDRLISIGSYLPNGGPPILVTFNVRGAVVERIELTGRDANGKLLYSELLDRSGYLGHLALTTDAAGGCRVNVVGQGTPAALASSRTTAGVTGLQVGDVIHHADSVPISTPANLDEFLAGTNPGQTILLGVHRPNGDSLVEMQLSVTLDAHPLQLIQPERPIRTDETVPLHPSSFLISLLEFDDKKAEKGTPELKLEQSLRNDNWRVAPGSDSTGIEFLLDVLVPTADGSVAKLEFIKRFRLGRPKDSESSATPYHLDYDIEIRNHSSKPHRIAYRVDGPRGLPLEGFWYSNKLHPTMFYVAGARDIVWKADIKSENEIIQPRKHQLVGCSELHKLALKAKAKKQSPEKVLFATDTLTDGNWMPRYIAVDTQYFLAAMIPVGDRQMVYNLPAAYVVGDVTDVPKAGKKSTNVSFHLDSQAFMIAPYDANQPDDTFTQSFEVYTGPKVPKLLTAYDLQDCIYYGWFGSVSKILAVVLHFFFDWIKNYGLAIVMLTVLVRSCMFPLSRKAAKNAAMMQVLSPQMKKIAEKYKDDMEKRSKAQQDLFKKHNYNPLGGCWMMFVQLPIFIGLYRCLSVDINLRQAALIPGIQWCSNLAGPDMLFPWPKFFSWDIFTELGMLGPYFNILPMFTVALFLVQQKLFTPPPTDDQSRMQLTMMKYMTVFIGVMFFKVASGLCLYFIASSLWGIGERMLLPKPKLAGDGGAAIDPAPLTPKPKPKPKPKLPDNGKSGRQHPRLKKKRR